MREGEQEWGRDRKKANGEGEKNRDWNTERRKGEKDCRREYRKTDKTGEEGQKESVADKIMQARREKERTARQTGSWERGGRGAEGECGRQIKMVKDREGETKERHKEGKIERGRRRERGEW
jgi:hypothetical protein